MDQTIGGGFLNANLAPDAFRKWATHYYECRQSFAPGSFSPVPYFLLCRAIELGVKSRHLTTLTQDQVKRRFGHDLSRAYDALGAGDKTLDAGEKAVLDAASGVYAGKGFEYFDPEDALSAYARYPDLAALDAVAKKLIGP